MAETTEEVKERSRMWGLLKAAGIVLGIVAVEVVAAAVLIPSAQETETTARKVRAASQGQFDPSGDPYAAQTSALVLKKTREVDLGRYNVTRYNPESDTTLIVDFELYG